MKDQKTRENYMQDITTAITTLAREILKAKRTFFKLDLIAIDEEGYGVISFGNAPQRAIEDILEGSKEGNKEKIALGLAALIMDKTDDEKTKKQVQNITELVKMMQKIKKETQNPKDKEE